MQKARWIVLLAVGLALAVAVGVAQAQSSPPEEDAWIDSVNVAGNLPWQYGILDSVNGGYTGRYVDIVVSPHDNSVFVSYYDATNQELRLARSTTPGAGNCGPNNEWNCSTVDTYGNVGMYSSIDVFWVDRDMLYDYHKIGISYYDYGNASLRYAVYTCAFTCSWTTYTVDISSDGGDRIGEYSSFKFNSTGEPNLAYHYYDDADGGLEYSYFALRYASYLGNGTGNCGDSNNWHCETVTGRSLLTIGTHISLDMDYGDSVYIAFYENLTGDLMYAYYQGFGGACSNTQWNCVTVDDGDGNDVGRFASLHAPVSATDKLRFAYYDYTDGDVRYAVNVGSGGNCTSGAFNCFVVDDVYAGLSLVGLSIAVDSEEAPIIAYMEAQEMGASRLRVARPASRMGQSFGIGNCGEAPPGYLFMYWWCQTIDPGYTDLVYEADYAAVDVTLDGRAYVAYYEDDTYYSEGRLKIAWQEFYMAYLPYLSKTP